MRTVAAVQRVAQILAARERPPPIPCPRAAAMREAAVSEVPVASGTQEVTHTISAVFALR